MSLDWLKNLIYEIEHFHTFGSLRDSEKRLLEFSWITDYYI